MGFSFKSFFGKKKEEQKSVETIVQKKVTINREELIPYVDRFKKAWKPVGNLNLECPYCGHKFEKIPPSKRKCPACKETIYPRTIPQSNKKSILSENDLIILDKQKTAVRGIRIHIDDKNTPNYQKAYIVLKKQFGKEPGHNDVLWRILNDTMLETVKDKNFGLLRNAHLSAAEILRKEHKFLDAMTHYFYVCHLDANGAFNLGSMSMAEYKEYGFNPKDLAMVNSGIISIINALSELAGLNTDEVKKIYYYGINRFFKYPYPIYNDKDSWKRIAEGLR